MCRKHPHAMPLYLSRSVCGIVGGRGIRSISVPTTMSDARRSAKIKKVEDNLEKKLRYALNHCVSAPDKNKFVQRLPNDCVVLWDEIEELSSTLNDIKRKRSNDSDFN